MVIRRHVEDSSLWDTLYLPPKGGVRMLLLLPNLGSFQEG